MATRPEQLEQLTAYLDGELSAAERQGVERLLEQDAEARRLFEELKRTSRLVAALPRGRAPADLSASVMARLERQALLGEVEAARPRRASGLGWLRPLGVAAGVVMMLTAGWLIYRQNQPAATQRPVQVAMAEKKGVGGEKGVVGDGLERVRKRTAPLDSDEVKKESADRAPARPEVAPKGGQPRRAVVERPPASKGEGPQATPSPSPLPAAKSEERIAAKATYEPPAAALSAAEEREAASGQVLTSSDMRSPSELAQAAGLPKESAVSPSQAEVFSNRIELVADADTRARLVTRVEHFMQSNQIPDLRSAKLPAPVRPEQAFYYVEPEKQEKYAAARVEQAETGEAVEVVLNAQAPQVERLIESMRNVARENRANVVWTANAVPVSDAEAPAEVMRQLTVNEQSVLAGRGPGAGRAYGKVAFESSQQQPMSGKPVAVERQVAAGGSGETAAAKGGPRGGGVVEPARAKGDVGAAGEARPRSSTAPDEDFITLAITFRVRPPSMQNAQSTPAQAIAPTQQSPASAPAQVQPAFPQGDGR